ncbi:TadE/TadG family type IV pilus assembly protein [Glycomyces buryatensis]|uniref:Pilus assembly protein n=1 Tax=Glycomyces buryatensis TaxID=2570927 RepID=A0A4S8Q4W7_9ACTN|nr:TadE family protein [Glycomyces buryatensis]THV35679.1 pilus assembly protein [Glycomyces buryatensis]
MRRRHPGDGRDDGSSTVETVLVFPVPVAIMLFIVVVTRLIAADIDLAGAAYHAARDASLQRTSADAIAAAEATATSSASACTGLDISVDLENFAPGDTVTVTLTCEVPTLNAPGFDGTTWTLTATGTARIDTWRSDL